ncbi:hypothetical protein XA26_59970 [Mycolicibacterium fortuitum]|uniref:Uncharacterized protein n=1 Tax=Mycolicibacterium fortuitum TaxID=1766 RepID=A0A0N9XSC4_MYCFO|nr:hypothetical protein XA26_59970 [Mycolicibacterium fortuitum]
MDLGVGHGVDPHVPPAMPGNGFQDLLPSLAVSQVGLPRQARAKPAPLW